MDREQFNKEFFRYLECGSCADLEFCNKYEIPACSTGSAMYRKFKLEDLEIENDQLKQRLAEKEKEFNWLHNKFAKNVNTKAIAELEKVKEWLNIPFDENGCFKNGEDLENYIDQQIKSLKGEN